MTKRILLFLVTNILIVVTISIVTSLLGLNGYMTQRGINYEALLGFCLVWGFGGAFISLLMSRWIAKMVYRIQIIDPNTAEPELAWLVERVQQFSREAGLGGMPEVGIYDSPDINAFATGPSKNRSLVAVSTGLLRKMNRSEAEGVLAHEVSHIANGDMVTMTLIQGVVNSFVMFFARIIAYAVTSNLKDNVRPLAQMAIVIVLEIALSFLGALVVMYFSRQREFRADGGGAKLAGKEKMIGALQRLQSHFDPKVTDGHQGYATMKISGSAKSFLGLLASHPSLETRIARLKATA